jgi:hypothetical protein
MNDHPQFLRLDDIVDQERNLFFEWKERNIPTKKNGSRDEEI